MSAKLILLSCVAGIVVYNIIRKILKTSRLNSLTDAPNLITSEDEKLMETMTKTVGTKENVMLNIKSNSTYEEQANAISTFVKTKILTVDDLLMNNTRKLFLLHREIGAKYEGGLGVRTTVQYNLFAGSVANLGDDKQREWLRGVFDRGELGCFALTEKGAGVLSGLIVETTCVWTDNGYVLNSPNVKSHKTWISQGITAKWCVIIARLILKDKTDRGPHAFIVDLKTKGVVLKDMVRKTDFNGLDNADISFNNCLIPLNSLLTKISYVDKNGEYKLRDENVPYKFYVVAQRLLSGRICIAGASIRQLELVLDDVIKYCDSREIPAGKDKFIKLSELPLIRDEICDIKQVLYVYKYFTILNEKHFMRTKNGVISDWLVRYIACGKTEIVEYCIDKILDLKLKVGSYCLQGNSCFGSQNDILYVYRFAEGDASILKQKMGRDCLKQAGLTGRNKNPIVGFPCLLGSIVWFYLLYILNFEYTARLKYKLNLNLLYLAMSMIGVSKDKQIEKWFESYKIIELVAILKANLLIYNAVYPALKETKQLESFKKNILDLL